MSHSTDLMSMPEIAEALGVKLNTVQRWRSFGLMPPPLRFEGQQPLWKRRDVAVWAQRTGRLRGGPLMRELRPLLKELAE